MNGTVKWFDKKRGFGFISGDNGKDYYVHHSHIYMRDAYKVLDTDDIVSFDVATDDKGREQAINVNPLVTRKWIKRALERDKLYVIEINKGDCNEGYAVVDQNNILQTGNNGLSFEDLAKYAGFDIDEIYRNQQYEHLDRALNEVFLE